MDEYKDEPNSQDLRNHFDWEHGEFIPDEKYFEQFQNSKLSDLSSFDFDQNQDISRLIYNIINGVDVDNAFAELALKINQKMVLSPNIFLDEQSFFPSTVNYVIDDSKSLDQKINALEVLIYMSLADIPENSEFTNENFLQAYIDSFADCDKCLIPYYVNLFLNCLSDENIYNEFSEKCFNNGLLQAIQKHLHEIEYTNYLINLLYRYLQISIHPLINLIRKLIDDNDDDECDIDYYERPFMELIPFFNDYISNAKVLENFNYKCFICIELLTDLDYSRKAIIESSIPHDVLCLINVLDSMNFNNMKCFALMSLFNKFCELNTKYGNENYNNITIQFCKYFPENENEMKIFMDFIKRSSLVFDQMQTINKMGVYHKLIDESNKAEFKMKKEICFMFASILTKAIDSYEKYEWIKDAVELVFRTIQSFKGERLLIILLEIKNWFNSDDFDALELSEETDLKDSLEEIINSCPGDEIEEMCEEVIAFINQYMDE